MELKQIEADVVMVAECIDGAAMTVTVYPFWECPNGARELAETAARIGLAEAERVGQGYVRVTIHDYRESA